MELLRITERVYVKKMKLFIKENYPIVAILSICCLFLFYDFLFKGKIFEFIADQQLQYHLFYEEWSRLLKDFVTTGEFPFYSWYTFLGTDFFASKMYYVTFDFFMPLVLLFEDMSKAMLYITIILIVLSGLSMKCYLNSLELKKSWVKGLISIVYSLSGIATLYYGNYMFHRFYALLPILFASVEQYLKNRKRSLFIFIVFVLFTQNYYFMYPTSLFLIGYYIASSYSKSKDKLINIIKSAIPLIRAYFVGLLMSAIVLIPTVLFLLTSPRLGNAGFEIFWEPKVYLGILCSLFVSPFNIYTDIPHFFYSGDNGHGHWYSLFCSVLTPVILCSSLNKKNKNFPFVACLGMFLVILMIKPFNSVMHAFSEASFRWTFLLVFLLLVIVALVLDENEFQFKQALKKYVSLLEIMLLCFVVLQFIYKWNIADYKIYLIILLAEMILGFIYLFLLLKKKTILLSVLVIFEMLISNYAIITLYSKDYYYYESSLSKEEVQRFLNTEENQLARIYIDPSTLIPHSAMNMNQSLRYNYMSTVTYDSTYESVLAEFLSWQGINWHIINLNDPEILELLGVKYYGVLDPFELPDNGNGYQYRFNLNAYQMYELPTSNSIAHTFTEFISKSEFNLIEDKSNFNWNQILILNDEDMTLAKDIEIMDKVQLDVESHSNNQMIGKIETTGDSILFTSIPYSSGWKVTSGTEVLKTINVEGGFLGIVLPAGNHELVYKYTSPGVCLAFLFSSLGLGIFLFIVVKERRKINTF